MRLELLGLKRDRDRKKVPWLKDVRYCLRATLSTEWDGLHVIETNNPLMFGLKPPLLASGTPTPVNTVWNIG